MGIILKIDLSIYGERYRFNEIVENSQCEELILDFSSIGFVKPEDNVHLMCIIDKSISLTRQGVIKKASLKYPKDRSVKDYMGRVGVFDKAKKYEYEYSKYHSSNFSELIFINSDRNDELGEKIEELLNRGRFATAGLISDLTESLTEAADNIFFHSGSKYGVGWGYFQGQTYQNNLHVAMCDLGVGFRGSYERAGMFIDLSDEEIIFNSLTESVTSTDDPWRGIGLHCISEFIENFSGTLSIESGKGRVIKNQSSTRCESTIWNMSGTLLNLKIPL